MCSELAFIPAIRTGALKDRLPAHQVFMCNELGFIPAIRTDALKDYLPAH